MLSAAFAALALAASAATYSVDPSASVMKFHLHHKMHEVDGKSSQIEGKAVLAEDGKVMAMVRVPAASFDTGDGNRDSHMRETLESAKFPFVVFKGVTSLVVPAAQGKPLETKIVGELDFHGVKKPLSVPAQLVFERDGSVTVSAKFTVNLEAHKIERPSLLFVKVDEDVQLDVQLRLKPAK
jgi:polyisoprenoid-binding protein YceI